MLDLIGKQLGQYEILEELGRGGMAVVFKAYQPSLNRYVALKALPSHYQDDAELLARFRREAEATRALLHPNIVRVFEVGEAQGMPFIAMEYVEGGSVAQEMARRRGPLDVATATGIAAQVAAALDSAHRQGVIHRDVKPSNILLARDGRVLLSDFGIAKKAGRATLTQKGTLLGTPAYMSPEQARGRRDLDGRSDIYSLGIVLYEMLTGDVPFHGDDPTVILRAILDDAPPPPSWLNPSIPPALERIVLRALAKQPEQRYATAGEMLAALEVAAPASPVPAPPAVTGTAVPSREGTPAGHDAARQPVAVAWTPLVAAGCVLVAVVALVLRGLGGRPSQASPTLTLPRATLPVTETVVSVITSTATMSRLPPTSTRVPTEALDATPTPVLAPTSTLIPSRTPTRRPLFSVGQAVQVCPDCCPEVSLRRDPAGYIIETLDAGTELTITGSPESAPMCSDCEWEVWWPVRTKGDLFTEGWVSQWCLEAIPSPRAAATDTLRVPQAGATHVLGDTGITLVYVPAGEFLMGSTDADPDAGSNEKPQHRVNFAGYWIGRTEVTNAQYRRFVEAGGYSVLAYWSAEGWAWRTSNNVTQPPYWTDSAWNEETYPVVVSWYEAEAFCRWAGGRLPTEAEWEYGARGGPLSLGYVYAGSNDPNAVAWYDYNSDSIHAVKQKTANELGLYDLSGNAWEWCADWYDASYYGQPPTYNPTGPVSGTRRVIRGGSWYFLHTDASVALRVATRYHADPTWRNLDVGFRVAK